MTENELEELRRQFGETQIRLLGAASFIEVNLDEAIVTWLTGNSWTTDPIAITRKVFIRTHLLAGLTFGPRSDLFAEIIGRSTSGVDADLAARTTAALGTFTKNRNMVVHGHFWRSDKGPQIYWPKRGRTVKTPVTRSLLKAMAVQASEVESLAFNASQAVTRAADDSVVAGESAEAVLDELLHIADDDIPEDR